MNGIDFLERIMRLRPMPVVMCSSLTARGADITIEAMRLGAVDCIAKPSSGPAAIADDAQTLRDTVKAAGRSTMRRISHDTSQTHREGSPVNPNMVVAIAASTGGVEALFALLSALPAHIPPMLIVQHMPGAFTTGFARRLNSLCPMNVIEAQDGQTIEAGTVYVAPGSDSHMELVGGRRGRIKLRRSDLVSGHRPSADVLFQSCAELKGNAVGVIMTGMGQDGAEGLYQMHSAGAKTFGQNEESCVIYGMPRAAKLRGGVMRELSLSALPKAIMAACQEKTGVK
jgi:two-component system chemotaxis response regulator CheB